MPETINKLTVLYDPRCALCQRCRRWMRSQPQWVEVEFLSYQSTEARDRYNEVAGRAGELVVVANTGQVWTGGSAFIVALWALHDWRAWSYRLSAPMLAPLAQGFFMQVSNNRHWLSTWVRQPSCENGECETGGRPYR